MACLSEIHLRAAFPVDEQRWVVSTTSERKFIRAFGDPGRLHFRRLRNVLEELRLPLPQISAATGLEVVDLPALVDAHAATLFRVAHAVLRNRAEAEDAVQDTFLRVLQHQRKLPAVRDLRPWLVRITWNLAMDRCRARRRGNTPEQADDLFLDSLVAPQIPHDQALHDAEQSRLVLQAIDRLPKPERQALLLSALDELPTAEIADIMGKTDSAIRALIHRARTRLRERLGAQPLRGGKR